MLRDRRLENLPAQTICVSGNSKENAKNTAIDSLPSRSTIVAAHWIHLPGHANPDLRWHVVLAFIVSESAVHSFETTIQVIQF